MVSKKKKTVAKKPAAKKPKPAAKPKTQPIAVVTVNKYAGLVLEHGKLIAIADGKPTITECSGPVKVTVNKC